MATDVGRREVDRARHELRKTLFSSSAFGALLVFVFLGFILPPPKGTPPEALVTNLPVFAAYLGLTLVIGHRWGSAMTRNRLAWLAEDRPPTPTEQRLALRLPLAQIGIVATFWAAGALIFSLLDLQYTGEFAGRVATAVALGGLATCALSYLLAERALRPVTVRALAARTPIRPVGLGVTTRILLAWGLATGVPLLGIVLVVAGILHGDTPENHATAWSLIFLGALALAFGAVAMALSARAIAEPIEAVRGAMARVEQGEQEAAVTVSDGSEVGLLQAGFNHMADGLRERERLQDLFGRHVGEEVARQALDREVALGGELREAAVLFVDVIGSTSLAARTPPEQVVERLNRFFALVQQVIERCGGWINKFEGDAALAVFGVPLPVDDPAGRALCAARSLAAELAERSPLPAAIGVSAGQVVAGNLGSPDRFEYTVIGDPVNEAARLSELAKQRPPHVLASDAALDRAGDDEAGHWGRGASVTLRGREKQTVLAAPADLEPDRIEAAFASPAGAPPKSEPPRGAHPGAGPANSPAPSGARAPR